MEENEISNTILIPDIQKNPRDTQGLDDWGHQYRNLDLELHDHEIL